MPALRNIFPLLYLVIHGILAVPQPQPALPLNTVPDVGHQHAIRDIAETTYSPSSTCPSYATITEGPACAGCILEAIEPKQLSFPGTVIHLTPTVTEYAIINPDGCTSYSTTTKTPICTECETIFTAASDITWTWKQATLFRL
ncbi:hypothetical protein BFW01_g11642 [Lasiodiplodia theobromae]|nr:hypothetical protein BFW01_g11642 [Lasiodiplodia theobromae]